MKSEIEEKASLLDRLVQLESDGPNVTKSTKTSINKWLTEGHYDLLDLGSCHAHNLHNSLKRMENCEQMGRIQIAIRSELEIYHIFLGETCH